jgi:hypothetical protein
MKNRTRIAVALVAVVLAVGGAFAGFAAAGGFDKPTERVVSDSTVGQRGSAYYPADHAQANVDSTGTAYRVKGFSAIIHPATGVYCLQLGRGIKPASYVAIATPDYSLSPNTDVSAQWRSSSLDCPSTRWVEVMTFWAGATASDQGFSVVVP